MLVATIAALFLAVQDAAPTPAPWMELPAGPLRDAVLGLAPDLEPAAPPEGFGAKGRAPGLAAGALLEAATWSRWRAALLEVRASGGKDARAEARARAVLALVALEQGRHRDAPAHLAAGAAEPALLAARWP
ncbi:MAG: hypothetical protein HZA53_14045, partial [Planctomycetes bacterium]|nr:hypothetical protein [Planctomycetota bacterium]